MLSKQKFSDLPLLALKFSKFLRSFLERRVRFPSNFAWFFSVMRHKSSVLFQINLYMFSTKGTHRSAYFQAFDCSHEKLTKFLLSFFKPRVSFSLNFAALLSVMTLGSIILLKFSIQLKHSMLWTKRTHQDTIVQTSECSSESSSNSSCHFWYHKFIKDKCSVFFSSKSSSKWKFQTFEWLGENSRNYSCHVWNHKSVFL